MFQKTYFLNYFLFQNLSTDPTSNVLAPGSLTAANTGTSQAAYGSNAANLMSQGAQAMGQGVYNAGQATAAGQMGAGNTYNNAINAALTGYQNNQMMDLFRKSAYSPQQIAYANRMNVSPYASQLFDES
mgnify:CR=1 FL=1